MPLFTASAVARIVTSWPSIRIVPLGGPGDPEQRLHELRPPGADEAVEPEDLAAAQGEPDIGEFGRVVVAFDLQHHVAATWRALGEDVGDLAPDHHLDQRIVGHVGNPALANELAVAKHGVIVGDPEDLVELVADEQDRLALGLQLLDQLVKLLDFLVAAAPRSARP